MWLAKVVSTIVFLSHRWTNSEISATGDEGYIKCLPIYYEVKKKHTGKKQRRIFSRGEEEQLRSVLSPSRKDHGGPNFKGQTYAYQSMKTKICENSPLASVHEEGRQLELSFANIRQTFLEGWTTLEYDPSQSPIQLLDSVFHYIY